VENSLLLYIYNMVFI